MPNGEPWLSGNREQQLVIAGNWLAILTAKAEEWNIPAPEVAALNCLIEAASLAAARNAEGTPETSAVCRAFFEALNAKMEFIKNRYLFRPPLTEAGIVSLDLKSGETACFCIRDENAPGEPGPWGPVFGAVIP